MQLQEIIARVMEAMMAKHSYRTHGYPTQPHRTGGARTHKCWKTRRAAGRA